MVKGGNGYTEDAAIEALRESYPHLVDHLRSGRDAIVWRGQQQPIDYVEAERAWEIAKAAILSGLYKTIILDELNPTVDLELLPMESIHQTLLKKPTKQKLLLLEDVKMNLHTLNSPMFTLKWFVISIMQMLESI